MDFHPHQQTIALCSSDDGEVRQTTLLNNPVQVRSFYEQFQKAVIGVEASSTASWFEQMLANIDYRIQEWTNYRENAKAYYNDPTYFRQARSAYRNSQQQLIALNNSKGYYHARLAEAQTCVLSPRGGGYELSGGGSYKSGREDVYEETWYKPGESPVKIELRTYQYDDGSFERREYERRRAAMANAGYSFGGSILKSQRRF